ncbi:MAG TPA: regulatory protein RecX [Clostridia bacterium]|nr:regulatory protein RecX [Clostridia bacterium]
MTELNKKALSYALTLLGRKRYAKNQLEQKLRNRGFPEEDVKAVILYCEERNYLNDGEFARFWIEDRIRFKPMGRRRLRSELLQQGIREEIINQVLDELLPEEQELLLAKNAVRAKLTKLQSQGVNQYKLFNFLLRRGFSPEIIRRSIYELGIDFSEVNQT